MTTPTPPLARATGQADKETTMSEASEQGDAHAHAFLWQNGRYVCPCGVWCYDLPDILPPEAAPR